MRKLTKIEEFFIKENVGRLSAEEIAEEIPGWGTKTIQEYMDRLALKELDMPTAPTPKNDLWELSDGDKAVIKEEYTKGSSLPNIARLLNKDEECIKLFIANELQQTGQHFFRSQSTLRNRTITVGGERASEHADLVRKYGGKPKRDTSRFVTKIRK